jgi:hypothetical protein
MVAAELQRRYPHDTISAFRLREPSTDLVIGQGRTGRSRECGSREFPNDA